jgi:hypothetical protein
VDDARRALERRLAADPWDSDADAGLLAQDEREGPQAFAIVANAPVDPALEPALFCAPLAGESRVGRFAKSEIGTTPALCVYSVAEHDLRWLAC